MFHSLFSQLVDEVAANVLLHRYLRRRRSLPARGPDRDSLPGLFSGAINDFYAPVPAVADLEADRWVVDRNADRTVWDCRFTSETTSPWPENNRVWCRHWEAHIGDNRLTVVGVDGIVQLGSRWFRRLAEELNPHGVDVVMMDAPCNFRRTPSGYRPGELIFAGDFPHLLANTRQAVLDLWRVILTLQRQGRRVGIVGVSYGGWLSLLASLVAADLEFLIALVPPVELTRMLRQSTTVVRGIRRGLGLAPLDHAEIDRMARPLVPLLWQPQLSGSRIVLHAAQYDRLVPYRGIERLAQRWGAQLVHHRAAHYRLALSPATTGQVAAQVLKFRDGNRGEEGQR